MAHLRNCFVLTALACAVLLLPHHVNADCDDMNNCPNASTQPGGGDSVNSASRLLPADAGVPRRVAQVAPLRVTLPPRPDGDELHGCEPTTLDAQVAALHGALVSFVVTSVDVAVIVDSEPAAAAAAADANVGMA